MKFPKDPETEARIYEEVIVDVHDDDEIVVAWQQYFSDTVNFPFEAYLAVDRTLEGTQTIPVQVIGLHPRARESYHNMWLMAYLPEANLHVAARPEDLHQMEALKEMDEETYQTWHDWCYWTQHMT